jgi:hypothetical protein
MPLGAVQDTAATSRWTVPALRTGRLERRRLSDIGQPAEQAALQNHT